MEYPTLRQAFECRPNEQRSRAPTKFPMDLKSLHLRRMNGTFTARQSMVNSATINQTDDRDGQIKGLAKRVFLELPFVHWFFRFQDRPRGFVIVRASREHHSSSPSSRSCSSFSACPSLLARTAGVARTCTLEPRPISPPRNISCVSCRIPPIW